MDDGVEALQCSLCPFRSEANEAFVKHLKDHLERLPPSHNNYIFACPYKPCKFGSKDEVEFGQHLWSHTAEDRIFYCEKCGAEYSTDDLLFNHIIAEHFGANSRKRFPPRTLFDFEKNRVRAADSSSFDVIGSFNCPYCGKAFTTKRYLNMHLRQHNDRLPRFDGIVNIPKPNLRENMRAPLDLNRLKGTNSAHSSNSAVRNTPVQRIPANVRSLKQNTRGVSSSESDSPDSRVRVKKKVKAKEVPEKRQESFESIDTSDFIPSFSMRRRVPVFSDSEGSEPLSRGRKVARTCAACALDHSACDYQKPCTRCIKLGKKCIDRVTFKEYIVPSLKVSSRKEKRTLPSSGNISPNKNVGNQGNAVQRERIHAVSTSPMEARKLPVSTHLPHPPTKSLVLPEPPKISNLPPPPHIPHLSLPSQVSPSPLTTSNRTLRPSSKARVGQLCMEVTLPPRSPLVHPSSPQIPAPVFEVPSSEIPRLSSVSNSKEAHHFFFDRSTKNWAVGSSKPQLSIIPSTWAVESFPSNYIPIRFPTIPILPTRDTSATDTIKNIPPLPPIPPIPPILPAPTQPPSVPNDMLLNSERKQRKGLAHQLHIDMKAWDVIIPPAEGSIARRRSQSKATKPAKSSEDLKVLSLEPDIPTLPEVRVQNESVSTSGNGSVEPLVSRKSPANPSEDLVEKQTVSNGPLGSEESRISLRKPGKPSEDLIARPEVNPVVPETLIEKESISNAETKGSDVPLTRRKPGFIKGLERTLEIDMKHWHKERITSEATLGTIAERSYLSKLYSPEIILDQPKSISDSLPVDSSTTEPKRNPKPLSKVIRRSMVAREFKCDECGLYCPNAVILKEHQPTHIENESVIPQERLVNIESFKISNGIVETAIDKMELSFDAHEYIDISKIDFFGPPVSSKK